MKIALDARILQFEKSGLYRVTRTIIDAVKTEHELYLLASNSAKLSDELLTDPKIKVLSFGPNHSLLAWWWENISLVRVLRKLKPDIFHVTHNFGLPLIKINNVKYLGTINDLLPAMFPDSYKLATLIRWHVGTRITSRSADILLTISDYSKSAIINYFKICNKNKVKAIHLFASSIFFDSNISPHTEDWPYVVYHGGFRQYKNVNKAIESFFAFKDMYKTEHRFLIVGEINNDFRTEIHSNYSKNAFFSSLVFTGFVNDSKLASILKGADCHLFLSLQEGFGFPPLEALACGTKLVCAKNSSLPEILQDVPFWVNDNDSVEVIASTINKAIRSEYNAEYSKTIKEKFTESSFSNNLLEIYK